MLPHSFNVNYCPTIKYSLKNIDGIELHFYRISYLESLISTSHKTICLRKKRDTQPIGNMYESLVWMLVVASKLIPMPCNFTKPSRKLPCNFVWKILVSIFSLAPIPFDNIFFSFSLYILRHLSMVGWTWHGLVQDYSSNYNYLYATSVFYLI